MNLINKPYYVHLLLRAMAPVLGLMPGSVEAMRYRLSYHHTRNKKHPQTADDRLMADYFTDIKDREKLRIYGELADKYAVREFVADRVGDRYLTKLYGHWNSEKDIDFEKLPVPCVIKTTNGCGTNIIIRTKDDLNPGKIRRRLHDWMHYPYGKLTGQPHYSVIPPTIIAEEYLDQKPGEDILPYDYKFFCFNGEPRLVLFCADRKLNGHVSLNSVYDLNWQHIPDTSVYKYEGDVPRPEALDDMIKCVRELSKGFKFVRVDFYGIGKRAIFGEMTFTPDLSAHFNYEYRKKMLSFFNS